MSRQVYARLVAFALAQGLAPAAWAQTGMGSEQSGPLRLGPLSVAPTVTLTSYIETNVFNDPQIPARDVVTNLSPQFLSSLKLGPVLFSGGTAVPYTHFTRYGNEGGLGFDQTLKASLPRSRFVPYFEAGYQNLKQRQNLEIDARVRLVQQMVTAGAGTRITPHITFEIAAGRQKIGYASAVLHDVNLDTALAERADTLTATVRRSITPLTDITGSFEMRRDRFDASTVRNADSERIMVGLQSTALLKGSAKVGYRNFSPLDPTVPGFKGLVGAATFECLLPAKARVALEAGRDVAFSYQVLQPYYLTTSAKLSVTAPLPFALIAQVGVGAQRLDYRALTTATVAGGQQTGTSWSASLAHRLGRHTSVVGSVQSDLRIAQQPRVSYSDRRLGTSIAYVF